jgi:hypothetical protein
MVKYRYLVLIFTLLFFNACFPVETTKIYSRDLTKGQSHSEPIYLSFLDNKNSSFYFILSRDMAFDQFLLKVRWINQGHDLQFNGQASTLKFLVDNESVFTLLPIKMPKIASYRIDEGGLEEEALYMLTREELTKLANAKDVSVELTGKNKIVIGTLNRLHSFKAFKDFLING